MQRRSQPNTSRFQQILRQAFAINKVPLPWAKAFGAGFCSAFPILLGLWFGYLQYGFIMSLGGLAFLYTFNEPYVLRAKKIIFVVLGLSFSAGLGTVLSANPILSAIAVGIIGVIAVFFFGAYQFAGPSALFFVLVFLINANTDTDPSLAIVHAALVFAGGILSLCYAMAGWFFSPLRVETTVVKEEYQQLALMMESEASSSFIKNRQKTWGAIKKTEAILASGYASWMGWYCFISKPSKFILNWWNALMKISRAFPLRHLKALGSSNPQ